MGQALENVVDRDKIVHAAYRENLATIAQLIPYLQDRQMAAKKYLTYTYEDQRAYDAIFEHIQVCNKIIADILGIKAQTT